MSELDYTALSLIFTRYYRRLVQYCTGYLGSYDEAEDIVQDAFVRVWEKRNSLRSEAIGALLFTMVRNSCLNSLKHRAVVDKFEAEFTPPMARKGLPRSRMCIRLTFSERIPGRVSTKNCMLRWRGKLPPCPSAAGRSFS